jgi:hypothetical protein
VKIQSLNCTVSSFGQYGAKFPVSTTMEDDPTEGEVRVSDRAFGLVTQLTLQDLNCFLIDNLFVELRTTTIIDIFHDAHVLH